MDPTAGLSEGFIIKRKRKTSEADASFCPFNILSPVDFDNILSGNLKLYFDK
jgi:hypothetical protein